MTHGPFCLLSTVCMLLELFNKEPHWRGRKWHWHHRSMCHQPSEGQRTSAVNHCVPFCNCNNKPFHPSRIGSGVGYPVCCWNLYNPWSDGHFQQAWGTVWGASLGAAWADASRVLMRMVMLSVKEHIFRLSHGNSGFLLRKDWRVCLMILNWRDEDLLYKILHALQTWVRIFRSNHWFQKIVWNGHCTASNPQPPILTQNSSGLMLAASHNMNYCTSGILIIANLNCDCKSHISSRKEIAGSLPQLCGE